MGQIKNIKLHIVTDIKIKFMALNWIWYCSFVINVFPYSLLVYGRAIDLSQCVEQCEVKECTIPELNCECYDICDSDFREDEDEDDGTSVHRRRRNAINVDNWPKEDDGLIYIPYDFDNQVVEANLLDVIGRVEEE